MLLSGCDFWIVGQGFSGSRRTRPKCLLGSCPVRTRNDWHVGLICASFSSYPASVLQMVAAGSSAGIHGLMRCDLVPSERGIRALQGLADRAGQDAGSCSRLRGNRCVQDPRSDVRSDGPHEERRHAVADLADPLCEISCEDESIGKRTESLELRKGKPAAFGPVHRAAHSKIAVHASYGVGGLPGIEPDRVESVSRNVLLRSADPDPVPEPIGFVFLPGLEKRCQLLRRRRAPHKRFACLHRHRRWAWMGVQMSSRTPMKIINSRDCDTQKHSMFVWTSRDIWTWAELGLAEAQGFLQDGCSLARQNPGQAVAVSSSVDIKFGSLKAAMRLHILSDLHLEFRSYESDCHDADVVVLAGDIHLGTRGVEWARRSYPETPVLYVLGNHEYYGHAYPRLVDKALAAAAGSKVQVLEKRAVEIGGVLFLGCTLWTDFALLGNPVASGIQCSQLMTDFRRIRVSPEYRRFRTKDAAVVHAKSLKWLHFCLDARQAQRVVVITHHAPHPKSLPDGIGSDPCNPAYASDLSGTIQTYHPVLWVHGHVHRAWRYQIDSTQVVSNPRGYPGEVTGFDSQLVIDV